MPGSKVKSNEGKYKLTNYIDGADKIWNMVHVTVPSQMAARWRMKLLGALHHPKVSGNFGQKSNGNVRFRRFFQTGIFGASSESDRTEICRSILTKRSTALLLFTYDKPHALSQQVATSFCTFLLTYVFPFRVWFVSSLRIAECVLKSAIRHGSRDRRNTRCRYKSWTVPSNRKSFSFGVCKSGLDWKPKSWGVMPFLVMQAKQFWVANVPHRFYSRKLREKKCITNWNCSLTHI